MNPKNMLQIQVKDSKYFIDGNVKAVRISKDGTVLALVGRLRKPAGIKAVHAFLFPKSSYTQDQAQRYIEEHRKEADKQARIEEKFITVEKGEFDETDASFWATASTNAPDRVGDVIHAEGWDLTNFKKNPVIQPFHDYEALPVAKAVDIYTRDNSLRFKPKFAVDIPKYDLPGIMYSLYKGGFMSAFSVGFNPTKWAFTDPDNWCSGIEYFEQELLEISAVPVPCHPDALIDPQYQRMMKTLGPKVMLDLGALAWPMKDGEDQDPAPAPDAPAPAPQDPAPAPGDAQDAPPAPPADPIPPAPAPEGTEGPTPAPGDPAPVPPAPAPDPVPAPEPAPQDPPAPPAVPEPAPAEPEKAVFMPVLDIKNVDELYEIASILKTGRLMSDRNRQKIKGALKELDRTREALTALLKLTEVKASGPGGEAKGDNSVAEILESLTTLKR